jgi:phosphohistidine phosphatase
MKVYLVQHAEAMSEEQDPERPLTDRGRQQAESTATVAARMGVEVEQIRHSGKTRAMETAEMMGEALSPKEGVVEASGLGPVDDVKPVARELDASAQPVMLVGHLPFMERIAGYLLTGDAEQPVIDFTNAAIVCLAKQKGRWQATWIVTPEVTGIKG